MFSHAVRILVKQSSLNPLCRHTSKVWLAVRDSRPHLGAEQRAEPQRQEIGVEPVLRVVRPGG